MLLNKTDLRSKAKRERAYFKCFLNKIFQMNISCLQRIKERLCLIKSLLNVKIEEMEVLIRA